MPTEEAPDEICVARTSHGPEPVSGEAAIAACKRLALTERASRNIKALRLNVRLFHVCSERRMRAHVILCMLAGPSSGKCGTSSHRSCSRMADARRRFEITQILVAIGRIPVAEVVRDTTRGAASGRRAAKAAAVAALAASQHFGIWHNASHCPRNPAAQHSQRSAALKITNVFCCPQEHSTNGNFKSHYPIATAALMCKTNRRVKNPS